MQGLPAELQQDIMGRLDAIDLAVCACVSKDWRVISDDQALWYAIWVDMLPTVKMITPGAVHLDVQKQKPGPTTWARCGVFYRSPGKNTISDWVVAGQPCTTLEHYEPESLQNTRCTSILQPERDYKHLVMLRTRESVSKKLWTDKMLRAKCCAADSFHTFDRRVHNLQDKLQKTIEQKEEARNQLHEALQKHAEMIRLDKVFEESIRSRRSRSSSWWPPSSAPMTSYKPTAGTSGQPPGLP